jgi:hypothetical protein
MVSHNSLEGWEDDDSHVGCLDSYSRVGAFGNFGFVNSAKDKEE